MDVNSRAQVLNDLQMLAELVVHLDENSFEENCQLITSL